MEGRETLFAPSQVPDELRIARIMRYLMTDDSVNVSSAVTTNFYSEAYFLAGEEDAYAGYTQDELLGANAMSTFAEKSEFTEWDLSDGNFDDNSKAEIKKVHNPGLNPWVRQDIAALYAVAENWKKSYDENNGTARYIIRR